MYALTASRGESKLRYVVERDTPDISAKALNVTSSPRASTMPTASIKRARLLAASTRVPCARTPSSVDG
jgi:hypothetical protein